MKIELPGDQVKAIKSSDDGAWLEIIFDIHNAEGRHIQHSIYVSPDMSVYIRDSLVVIEC